MSWETGGPMLFQLPPNLKKDLPRLTEFLEILPRGWRSTFEFRHSSWFDDDVYEALRAKDAALCIADHDDFETPAVRTASWGYARLHRLNYDGAALRAWRERLLGLGMEELFVFFKHDEGAGSGPTAAEAFTGRPRRKSHLGEKAVAPVGSCLRRSTRVMTNRSLARVIPT